MAEGDDDGDRGCNVEEGVTVRDVFDSDTRGGCGCARRYGEAGSVLSPLVYVVEDHDAADVGVSLLECRTSLGNRKVKGSTNDVLLMVVSNTADAWCGI